MSDPESPIIDFYPKQFAIDLNGKKAAWMGVALLPFIDEERLHVALEKVYPDLTEEEKASNSLGPHLLFVSRDRAASYPFLRDLFEKKTEEEKEKEFALESEDFDSMGGLIKISKAYSKRYSNTFCLEYYDPKYPTDFIFPAIRHPNAKVPPKQLKPSDYVGQYRPTIGFEGPNSSRPHASIGLAGHRMLNSASYGHQNPRPDASSRFVQGFRQQGQQQQLNFYGLQSQGSGYQSWTGNNYQL
jgi:5'-3' exoribonuclease 2